MEVSEIDVNGLVIDKTVPIPNRINLGVTELVRSMEVGDSIAVPLTQRQKMEAIANNVRYKSQLSKRFTMRKIDANTCRLWRIA